MWWGLDVRIKSGSVASPDPDLTMTLIRLLTGSKFNTWSSSYLWELIKQNIRIIITKTGLNVSKQNQQIQLSLWPVTYISTSLFLLRIFMVLLSRPKNLKPYLETGIHTCYVSMFNCFFLYSKCRISSSTQSQKASSHLIAPLTRATSSGEDAIKPVCSCTSASAPKPSTSCPSTWSCPCSVDSFTWTVWQRHRARRKSSSFSYTTWAGLNTVKGDKCWLKKIMLRFQSQINKWQQKWSRPVCAIRYSCHVECICWHVKQTVCVWPMKGLSEQRAM